MIDFGASSKLTNRKVFHKIIFYKKYVFLNFINWKNSHASLHSYLVYFSSTYDSAVARDYTVQNSGDFVKQVNLGSLLLLFLFSYWVTGWHQVLSRHVHTDKIMFSASLCFCLELASWVDGCVKARIWALSIDFLKGFLHRFTALILQPKSIKFLFK